MKSTCLHATIKANGASRVNLYYADHTPLAQTLRIVDAISLGEITHHAARHQLEVLDPAASLKELGECEHVIVTTHSGKGRNKLPSKSISYRLLPRKKAEALHGGNRAEPRDALSVGTDYNKSTLLDMEVQS